MPILNYTTKIAATKTVGEIMSLLARHKADRILTDFSEGIPVGLTFQVSTVKGVVMFQLPANWQGVQKALEKQRVQASLRTKEQAIRVAWRILLDWVAAQMAIVEAELATVDQVFLPYALLKDGSTVYEAAITNNALKLHNGK